MAVFEKKRMHDEIAAADVITGVNNFFEAVQKQIVVPVLPVKNKGGAGSVCLKEGTLSSKISKLK